MKIAIVGGGISGLTAAWLLHRRHEITLIEAAPGVGGHTATVDCTVDGRSHAVDTGFIVFNDRTYPGFNRLLERIEVPWRETEMGFSVSNRHHHPDGAPCAGLNGHDFEYCGSSLNGLFADRRRLADRRFLGMLGDILRFGRRARSDLERGRIPAGKSLDRYLAEGGYGEYFLTRYVVPMASAIWSAPAARVQEFDALFFVRFFRNHGLLDLAGRPRWRVVEGGSRNYLEPLTREFRQRIFTGTAVREIHRGAKGVDLRTDRGSDHFDHVVLASHSDQSLALLADASAEEREVLGAIPYRDNSVLLHTDRNLLPRRERAWASWNYLLDGTENDRPVLTYNMNILQGILSDSPICVSVNADEHVDTGKVLRRFHYAHPQFGSQSVAAQARIGEINGQRNTWFCGAWCGNGFHEDGVASGASVAAALEGDAL